MRVVFLADLPGASEWEMNKGRIEFDYEVLPGKHWHLPRDRRTLRLNVGVSNLIRRFQPSLAIVGGWNAPAYWTILFHALLRARPRIVLWSGSNVLGRPSGRPLDLARSFFVKRCHSFIAYNKQASDYLCQLGAPLERVCVGSNVGEVETFCAQANAFRGSEKYPSQRRHYPRQVFMFVGYLAASKGPEIAIRALARVSGEDLGLFVVGDGPDRAKLELLAEKLLPHRVWFWGHQSQPQLAQLYALADFFILPSFQEAGSIALSEALSAGLYAIASTLDGNAHDLILPAVNGELTDPRDISTVVAAIERAVNMSNDRTLNRGAVQATIGRANMERYADAFEAAVQIAASAPGR
ncbi:MAG: glycosyltransferase family 4 protein [Acidobacteria bacterium]|nr:glycosyltransferase family 4 protein [Acidobacteriota bacterium]